MPLSWAEADRQFYVEQAALSSTGTLTSAEADRQRIAADQRLFADEAAAAGDAAALTAPSPLSATSLISEQELGYMQAAANALTYIASAS